GHGQGIRHRADDLGRAQARRLPRVGARCRPQSGLGRCHRGRRRRSARAHRRRRRHEPARNRGDLLGYRWWPLMFRHIALIVSLTLAALAAGLAMVPGEREQWTMLVRDGRNQEAVAALEQLYRAGKREVDAVLHLYKLYMAFADIDQATRVMRDFVTDHPDDPAALTLLARHYGEIQNKNAEIHTLERLFEVAPTLPTARELLTNYRLAGEFDREQRLLQTLL